MRNDSFIYFILFCFFSVRGVSREIGSLAMQRMQERQDRWRAKTADNPKLRYLQHHNVNSAIEMVVNEGLECMLTPRIIYMVVME